MTCIRRRASRNAGELLQKMEKAKAPAGSCWLTLGASSKQVFHVLLQPRDDLMMAFNHLIPYQWVMGKITAVSEKPIRF